MQFHYIILVSFIILSCGERKDDRSYEIPNLKENIKTFIDSKKCFENSINLLVVNLEVENDTLSVEIADTYPKVKEMKFYFDTVLYGHRVIFTGDRIKGYNKKMPASQFPPDILEISKSREWPFHEEFTLWLFLYKNGKLIYKDLPCAEKK
jgi:hypothetical protein